MNHRDVRHEDGRCIEVFQDCVKWWALAVLSVLNCWVLSVISLLWVQKVCIKRSGAFHTLFSRSKRGLFLKADG
jgi:hypothetical protein